MRIRSHDDRLKARAGVVASSSSFRTVMRMPPRTGRTASPCCSNESVEPLRVVDRHVEEVARARAAVRGRALAGAAANRSRSSRIGATSGGDCKTGERERGGQRRERSRMLALVQLGGDVAARERVADPRAGEAEDLRERAGARSRRRRSAPTAVSPEYSKYASSTTSGRAVGKLTELAGRIVRPAADRQHRVSSPISAPATQTVIGNIG